MSSKKEKKRIELRRNVLKLARELKKKIPLEEYLFVAISPPSGPKAPASVSKGISEGKTASVIYKSPNKSVNAIFDFYHSAGIKTTDLAKKGIAELNSDGSYSIKSNKLIADFIENMMLTKYNMTDGLETALQESIEEAQHTILDETKSADVQPDDLKPKLKPKSYDNFKEDLQKRVNENRTDDPTDADANTLYGKIEATDPDQNKQGVIFSKTFLRELGEVNEEDLKFFIASNK